MWVLLLIVLFLGCGRGGGYSPLDPGNAAYYQTPIYGIQVWAAQGLTPNLSAIDADWQQATTCSGLQGDPRRVIVDVRNDEAPFLRCSDLRIITKEYIALGGKFVLWLIFTNGLGTCDGTGQAKCRPEYQRCYPCQQPCCTTVAFGGGGGESW